MKPINSFILIFVALLALTACTSQGDLTVSDVWARPGIADGNTGVFFVIDNPTDQDDRLLSASSDVSQFVELHKTTMADGVMQMTPQEFVPVPAGEQVVFKPGDLHVMLIKLHDQLNVGDTFDLILVFENAGEIALTVTVQEQ
jgi:copper(I)-binding protein